MEFSKLYNEYILSRNKLSKFMSNKITEILKTTDVFIFYDNDIFVAVDSKDSSEYEEMDFVQSVYLEDDIIWVDTNCENREFTDLHLSEQIAIFNEITNKI
jgi:hypothetical protein